jgi:hypothetical protein
MRTVPALCLALAVLLAGCGAGSTPTGTPAPETPAPETTTDVGTTETPTETSVATASANVTPDSGSPDPDEDTVGRENGYWQDDPVDVDESDGLNDSEFEAVLARTIARVEVIRQQEFEKDLDVQFLTREQLQAESPFGFRENPFRDQFWEAAFVVGEDTATATALTELYDVVVDGYQGGERLVTIQENPDKPRVDPVVLAHEVSHAFEGPPMEEPPEPPVTTDEQLALRAQEEGQASWVDSRYEQRCGVEWDCIERPPAPNQAADGDVNMGLYLQFAAPYTLGEALQEHAYERGGLDAVMDVQRHPPTSTEQVVHTEAYREDGPAGLAVADRSGDDWRRLPGPQGAEADRMGEVVLYTMLWYNDVAKTDPVNVTVDQQTGLNYTHPATEGWEGDSFVAYTDGEAYGYVLKTTWTSEADAAEFEKAYLALLDERGAERVEAGVYRIPDGPFADAFRIVRDGDTVLVVNAPTVAALDGVHATE